MKECETYNTEKKIKTPRLEALRLGFQQSYEAHDFATIVAIAKKIPSDVVETDEKLLRYLDLKGSDPSVYVSLYMFDCGEVELAARECAKGTKVFAVNYGTKYVEVILASLATERLAKRAYYISARR